MTKCIMQQALESIEAHAARNALDAAKKEVFENLLKELNETGELKYEGKK